MKQFSLIFAGISLLALLVANLPLLTGQLLPIPGLTFLGRTNPLSDETFPYMSLIEQSRQSPLTNFLSTNLYAPTSPPEFLFPSYWLMGKVAAATHLSSPTIFFTFRFLFSALFLYSIFRLVRLVFGPSGKSLYATVLILFSSGLGSFISQLLPESADIILPSFTAFFTLTALPHQILSSSLLILLLSSRPKRRDPLTSSLLSNLFLFFLSLENPFAALIFLITMFFSTPRPFLILSRPITMNYVSFLLRTLLFTLPGLIYHFWLFYHSPAHSLWFVNHPFQVLPPSAFLLGLGLLLPFTLLGANVFLSSDRIHRFLLVWPATVASLLYLFPHYQNQLVAGVWIPLAILATEGIFNLKINPLASFRRVALTLILLLLCLPSLLTTKSYFSQIRADSPASYSYHLQPAELAGIDWLAKNTSRDDVIFANLFYGNIIPGLTGRRVLLGHSVLTPNIDATIATANDYLTNNNYDQAFIFLTQNHVSYIYLGVNDSMTQYGFHPEKAAYLVPVFTNSGVSIYHLDTSTSKY